MKIGFVSAAALSAATLVIACEDGPKQTYAPGPVDDGTGGGAWTDPAAKSLSTGTRRAPPTTCDTPSQGSWANALTKPIPMPACDDVGKSIDTIIADACTLVTDHHDGTASLDGGPLAIELRYDRVTRKVLDEFKQYWPGYAGSLEARSRDGQHSLIIYVNQQIQYDNAPFVLDWAAPSSPTDWRNTLFDTLLATFAPGVPAQDCNATGACIQGRFGDVGYFYVPVLGFALWTANTRAPQPAASIPDRIDTQCRRLLPFSLTPVVLKLDAQGPVAAAGRLSNAPNACTLQSGLAYGDFLASCVEVSGDAAIDARALANLVAGSGHDAERFHFDRNASFVDFTARSLAPNDVLRDGATPSSSDELTTVSITTSLLGRISNDSPGNDGAKPPDRHGTGLVALEYARLVQDELNRLAGGTRTLGDVACNAIGATDAQLSAAGCTGFEGMITQAPDVLVEDVAMKRLALGIAAAKRFGLRSLAAGRHTVAFCNDATGDVVTAYARCADAGDVFTTSLARVTKILGRGEARNVPAPARDLRFYFTLFTKAFVKYLHVAADSTATANRVHGVTLDADAFVTSEAGSGQLALGEYTDRRFVGASAPPAHVLVSADLANGIVLGYDFTRDMLRGERAMYSSMVDHRIADDPPGKQSTALFSNVFGSVALASAWHAHGATSAYFCATHVDTAACDGEIAPTDGNGALLLDDAGRPVLAPYEGAFGRTAWSVGGQSALTILSADASIASAMIRAPLHVNPYDPSSAPPAQADHLDALVPWTPKSPTNGFPIALDGTRDKWIESHALDLSGATLNATLRYDYEVDPRTHQQLTVIDVLAAESSAFLGDVFPCRDAATRDVLRVRMGTRIADVLDWLGAHPGASQSCGIVVRYSAYGNVVDSITSLANGVRLKAGSGGALARVAGVLAFAPGQ